MDLFPKILQTIYSMSYSDPDNEHMVYFLRHYYLEPFYMNIHFSQNCYPYFVSYFFPANTFLLDLFFFFRGIESGFDESLVSSSPRDIIHAPQYMDSNAGSPFGR